jgi:hypothetical protein
MPEIIRTERGWAGHFIGSASCNYRRNTLLEYGDRRVVISTVGNYRPLHNIMQSCPIQILGDNKYYETKVFDAMLRGPYWDANPRQEVEVSSTTGLYCEGPKSISIDVDLQADAMHEAVVEEMIARIVL